ncbi:MAG: putative DNA binding domain-containing protein [Spirochaetia bacterium]|nr:putative DNA binding domain-containing protein [Spirochaetia bacterium]
MPLTDSQILQLVAGGETLTVDFKREGYNLSNEKTKIECLKDILAIANVLAKDEKGYIVTGISLVSARPSFVGITKGEADDANFQQHITRKRIGP